MFSGEKIGGPFQFAHFIELFIYSSMTNLNCQQNHAIPYPSGGIWKGMSWKQRFRLSTAEIKTTNSNINRYRDKDPYRELSKLSVKSYWKHMISKIMVAKCVIEVLLYEKYIFSLGIRFLTWRKINKMSSFFLMFFFFLYLYRIWVGVSIASYCMIVRHKKEEKLLFNKIK